MTSSHTALTHTRLPTYHLRHSGWREKSVWKLEARLGARLLATLSKPKVLTSKVELSQGPAHPGCWLCPWLDWKLFVLVMALLHG
jgi:hypothetical protein